MRGRGGHGEHRLSTAATRLPPTRTSFDTNSTFMNDDDSASSLWPRTHEQVMPDSKAEGSPVTSPNNDELPTSPQASLKWLEDFLRDDSTNTYSYLSTWSSNYTTSNLPGPGRLLGKLLSKTGSSLERHLGNLAYRAGIGSYAKAETTLQKPREDLPLIYEGMPRKAKEKACGTLLRFARFVVHLDTRHTWNY